MLKSSADWLQEPAYKGIVVMDPDGWDRSNYAVSWAEEITEKEFNKRLVGSTCLWHGPLKLRIPACL